MNFDVAIVGSGLAGLSVALNLAETRRVAILAKRAVSVGASDWAQGGIAAVLDSADSVDNHVDDTLVAGGGLCDEAATRFIVENGRAAIEWLIDEGVPFTRDVSAELGFHLTREGGHSHRRIIHAADATGHAVVTTLGERVRNHPNITVLEDHYAIDLITSDRLGLPGHRCHGLYALDLNSGRTVTIQAPHTVLATGGAGKVYLYTTNPDTATGDGIAMAWRAGCRVANMEFIQFHPTCLFHPYAKSFLISEAVRGEGGVLRLPDGTRFMPAHDERAELAPRDIVARAIDFEIKKRGIDCVYLDISHQPRAFLEEHFPTILARCREFGIDITKQPIPVVPAAHYTCGGVVTRSRGAHGPSGAVCGRRNVVHGSARREPAREQFAARMPRDRPRGGASDRSRRLLERLSRRIARLGRKPRVRSGRGSRRRAQLGRTAASDVELRGHRAHGQAPRARATSACAACATRSTSTTRTSR